MERFPKWKLSITAFLALFEKGFDLRVFIQ